jgi:hypothetical protein
MKKKNKDKLSVNCKPILNFLNNGLDVQIVLNSIILNWMQHCKIKKNKCMSSKRIFKIWNKGEITSDQSISNSEKLTKT